MSNEAIFIAHCFFRQPESTSRAGKPSLRADRQLLAVLPLTTVSLRDRKAVVAISTQGVRNLLTMENDYAQTFSGSLKWFLRCRYKALRLCVNDCVIK
ncbi:MAG: hypothetical protein IIU35_00435 [Neisseriaceae bacterium]|nr:hypothetical protein [Neisseriaceae bacterium]